MSRLVIFGCGTVGEVAVDCFRHDSEYEVVAFTVDSEYMEQEEHEGLPVVPFQELEDTYGPEDVEVFVALGYLDINRTRERKVAEVREKGYRLASYVGRRVTTLDSVSFGEHVFVMNDVVVQPRVEIGDNTFVFGGAIIGHHSRIGRNCWIVSGANIAGNVRLGDNNFVAMNATIGNEVTTGSHCLLGANTLAIRDLPDETVLVEPTTQPFRLKVDDFLRMTALR